MRTPVSRETGAGEREDVGVAKKQRTSFETLRMVVTFLEESDGRSEAKTWLPNKTRGKTPTPLSTPSSCCCSSPSSCSCSCLTCSARMSTTRSSPASSPSSSSFFTVFATPPFSASSRRRAMRFLEGVDDVEEGVFVRSLRAMRILLSERPTTSAVRGFFSGGVWGGTRSSTRGRLTRAEGATEDAVFETSPKARRPARSERLWGLCEGVRGF